MTGIQVKIWMMGIPIKARDIAKEYGCSDVFVSEFLKGNRTSKDFVTFLIDKGCPEKNFKNGKVAA